MAATATRPDQIVSVGLGGGSSPRGGNGFHKNGGGKDGAGDFRFSPARYRLGVWAALASILMLFVALTSAYIVRSASSTDRHPGAMPEVRWLSTGLLIRSSFTIEIARRSLQQQR